MKRKLLTEPQYRLLARLDDHGGTTLGAAKDRTIALRLLQHGCAEHLGDRYWRITDHGRNIRDLHRSFFEPESETHDA